MQRYNCLLQVGGSPYNEVRLFDLPAAEIIVLRTIHRDDSVKDLRKSVKLPVSGASLRAHLEKKYSQALAKLKPKQSIQTLFGPAHMALPELLHELEPKEAPAAPQADLPDLADQERPSFRKRRARRAAEPVKAEEFDTAEAAD